MLFYGAMFALAATIPKQKADAIEATALLIAINLIVVLVAPRRRRDNRRHDPKSGRPGRLG